MTRFSAGLITGFIGAVLLVILNLASVRLIPLLIPIIAGVAAGILVARNPTFAGKTGGAGALAGLIAGAVFFIGAIAVGIVTANSGVAQNAVSVIQATATAKAGSGSTGTTTVPSLQIVQVGLVVGSCFLGLIYIGFSVAAGAIAGAISGRNTAAPAPVTSQASLWNPSDSPYSPPPGYGVPPGYPSSQDQPPSNPGQ